MGRTKALCDGGAEAPYRHFLTDDQLQIHYTPPSDISLCQVEAEESTAGPFVVSPTLTLAPEKLYFSWEGEDT